MNVTFVDDFSHLDLANAKAMKLSELLMDCQTAVKGGFTSNALGIQHTYPSNADAQNNFNTEMHRFITDPTYTSCRFFTLDNGFLTHTKDQFFKVFNDGHDWGNVQWSEYEKLASQVEMAQTNEAISSIKWGS